MVTEDGSVLAAPTLLEALPDAVVVADAGGRILYANAALTVLLGHGPAELVGRPLTELMPDRFRSALAAGFARFLATGRGELIEAYLLDFSGDLYGDVLRIAFLERLRGEKRFDSADDLVAQMRLDVDQAREIAAATLPRS